MNHHAPPWTTRALVTATVLFFFFSRISRSFYPHRHHEFRSAGQFRPHQLAAKFKSYRRVRGMTAFYAVLTGGERPQRQSPHPVAGKMLGSFSPSFSHSFPRYNMAYLIFSVLALTAHASKSAWHGICQRLKIGTSGIKKVAQRSGHSALRERLTDLVASKLLHSFTAKNGYLKKQVWPRAPCWHTNGHCPGIFFISRWGGGEGVVKFPFSSFFLFFLDHFSKTWFNFSPFLFFFLLMAARATRRRGSVAFSQLYLFIASVFQCRSIF